jgi:hypothetical protein
MDFQQFEGSLSVDLVFKKANVSSRVLKIDTDGILYSIGQKGNSKKVKFEEFQAAFDEIARNGCITRKWYNEAFPKQAKTASCNFTTIGGLLQHFSHVIHSRGVYSQVKS